MNGSGMFEKEIQLKNAEEFDPEQPFEAFKAEYVGITESAEYGKNDKAYIWAAPQGGHQDAARKYVLFGVMAQQVGRMNSGDLPATIKIGQDGRANILVKVG